jgi:hypothetical protein
MTNSTESKAPPPLALKLSAALSALCLVLIVAGPVMIALTLSLTPGIATEGLGVAPAAGNGDSAGFNLYQRITIIVVGLIPVAFATWGLIRARRCFRSFRRGEFFTADVIGNLRAFAAGIALWVVSGWLTTPIMSLMLTLFQEEKRVTVQFSWNDLMMLLFAGVVWLIADIMRRAAAIAEENAQFV